LLGLRFLLLGEEGLEGEEVMTMSSSAFFFELSRIGGLVSLNCSRGTSFSTRIETFSVGNSFSESFSGGTSCSISIKSCLKFVIFSCSCN